MKNLLAATLPALALLALGGCATSGALTTSTETDGVYYSSSDHTTAVASPSAAAYGSEGTIPARALDDTTPANVATTDDTNPDYQGGTAAGNATGTDYYNNTYNNGLSYYSPNGFNQPYNGPGVSSYNYAPAYGPSPSYYGSPYGYNSAFGYGYSPFSYGYSPFGYGSPYGGGFYDPFYSPFGYGSGLSIGFGYGFGGFGGFGSPFGYGYSPFGYGSPYGYGGYGSPYGYGAGYGYRGYGGYGGSDYARHVIYTRGAGASSPGSNAVLYGSRTNRGGAVMNPNVNANGNPNAVNPGGRPGAGSYTGNAVAVPGSTMAPAASPTGRGGRAVTFGDATGQPSYSTPGTSTPGTQVNAAPTSTPNTTAGRRGFFGGFFGNNAANSAGQPATAGQPANMGNYGSRQRSSNANYGQSSQPMQQRSYSQPAYSQPQRSYSQPSYSQPSPSRSFGGGGGGGGGSFGGGGGGGGGSRGRR